MEAFVFRRITLATVALAFLAGCGQITAATPGPAPTESGQPATTQRTAAPTTGAATGGGTHNGELPHALLSSVDPVHRTVTFDLLEWFTGKQAVAACKADGVHDTDDDRCVGWYFRNRSKELRTVPVAADARLRVFGEEDTMHYVDADLATFAKRLAGTGRQFTFEMADGKITRADEFYLP
jgi:hypothetical protein